METIILLFLCITQGYALTIPNYEVTVYEGDDLYVRLAEDLPGLESCYLQQPYNSSTLTLQLLQNGTDVSEGSVKFWGSTDQGTCGVWAKAVDKTNEGYWSLFAANGSGYSLSDNIAVSVSQESEFVRVPALRLGYSDSVTIGPPQGTYFQAEKPSGYLYDLQTTQSITVDPVTYAEGGNWTFVYGIAGRTQEIMETVEYIVYEVAESELTVASLHNSTKVNGGIDLLCRLKKQASSINIQYCRFIRPDGVGLFMNEGVGNAEYSYHGEQLTGQSYHDCGVTVHAPTSRDYGLWQCVMGFSPYAGGAGYQKGTFIEVPGPTKSSVDLKATPAKSSLVALKGKSITMKCHVQASLTACWFKHPNGTSIAARHLNTGNFTYSGYGLQLGDCGITVSYLTEADSGDWVCSAAVADYTQGDLQTTINLRVTDNYLITSSSTVEASSGESTNLQCSSTEPLAPLQYCRFVRPDGRGITLGGNSSVQVSSTYSYIGAGLLRGDCGLHISSVSEADFGTWTCAAMVMQQVLESQVAITLESNELTTGAIIGIAVGSVAVVVILIGGFFAYRKFSKK